MLARSVVGGALASVGVGAMFSPVLFVVVAVAYLLALIDRIFGAPTTLFEVVFAVVPGLIAVAVCSLVGGYVAGAMADRDRARNGAGAALLGLLAMLVYGLVFGLVGASLLGLTVAVGAILAIPVAMLFGHLGAVLAPPRIPLYLRAAEERAIVAAPSSRPFRRPVAVAGLKGGERMDEEREQS